MTDKEFNALKKKIDKVIDYWVPILGLADHRIKREYVRERHTDYYTIATTSPLWQYKTHTVTVYMPSLIDSTDQNTEEDILHELVHILVSPASGNVWSGDEHLLEKIEYATQTITFALIAAREAGRAQG